MVDIVAVRPHMSLRCCLMPCIVFQTSHKTLLVWYIPCCGFVKTNTNATAAAPVVVGCTPISTFAFLYVRTIPYK